MTLPDTATFREFAGIAKFRPSYISQLKADGRLVLTDDGKRVRVAESLQRIADTKDPAKIGVAARHAAARAAAEADAPVSTESAPAPSGEAEAIADTGTLGFQHWRERSERAKALAAERENAIAEGKLVAAEEVAAAIVNHTALLRTRLEALPPILAPQLIAASDEAHARALLADAIEHALGEMARQFGDLVKAAA